MKNHFIATLATTSAKFPITQWHKLLPLAELTLNSLLPWHSNPAISAYHGLTGAKFDFRAHSIAPAGTAILIHEPPEARGSWASHGLLGFYLGPAILHYRSHHVFVTATSATRITDTVAWFPATDITPPLPDTKEILIAAIKDLLHAIKKHHLTGEIIPPTLTQELQDFANLHNALPPDLSSAPKIGTDLSFWLSQTHFTPSQWPRNRSFHPALPTIYPPPPGLAPLPDTDRQNSLMGPSISPPTVPAAPTRRSPREHVNRVPNSFGYSALTKPDEPYFQLINSDHAMIMGEENLTSSDPSCR